MSDYESDSNTNKESTWKRKPLSNKERRLKNKRSRKKKKIQRMLSAAEGTVEEEAKQGVKFVPPALLPEHWDIINSDPNPGCKKCYGTGTLGWNHSIGNYNYCKCIKCRKSS